MLLALLTLGAKQNVMPVIFRDSGLRYFFFSNEGSPREEPHIHVKQYVDFFANSFS